MNASDRMVIVVDDGFVSVNGQGWSTIDLSFMPENVKIVQYYGSTGGHIYTDNEGEMILTVFDNIENQEWFAQALAGWQEKQDLFDAAYQNLGVGV